ncbi:MAG: prephenate dehydratase domain-containing protein [Tessaracoccus sp.]
MIKAEIVIPVEFGFYARKGTRLEDVRQVLTHGHAAAQCREWLALMLPDATVTEAGSTAGAAAEVARPDSRYDGAVCARVAGRLYHLEELAYRIEDNPGAVTRFVQVGRPGPVPERTGADKTTLVAYMREDHAGALLEILEQFAVRGEPQPDRIAPDEDRFGIILLLHRRGGASARRAHRRGPHRPSSHVPDGVLPGFLPPRRSGTSGASSRRHRRGLSRGSELAGFLGLSRDQPPTANAH